MCVLYILKEYSLLTLSVSSGVVTFGIYWMQNQFNSFRFYSFVIQLSGYAGISVSWIVLVMTNCCFMSDPFSLLAIAIVHLEVINPVLWFPGLSAWV